MRSSAATMSDWLLEIRVARPFMRRCSFRIFLSWTRTLSLVACSSCLDSLSWSSADARPRQRHPRQARQDERGDGTCHDAAGARSAASRGARAGHLVDRTYLRIRTRQPRLVVGRAGARDPIRGGSGPSVRRACFGQGGARLHLPMGRLPSLRRSARPVRRARSSRWCCSPPPAGDVRPQRGPSGGRGPGRRPLTGAPSPTTPEGPEGIFKLDHLIFIVQENRSFDHYFGTYPGADGIPNARRPSDGCVPDTVLGRGSCAYHTSMTSSTEDRTTTRRRSRRQRRQDGRVHRRAPPDADGAAWTARRRSATASWARGQPDVMSYPPARRSRTTGPTRTQFVLQDPMFAPTDSLDPARTPVPRLGVVRLLLDPNDPMSCSSTST